ncbi:DUF4062 domain-containing protein [Bacillus sp. JJ1127]|uniref:DUF4062 domain-containing protein n=1 Tax=Bacillus sp. JJ1127 TaxID=3122952 RepID=UPI002FFE39D6
MQKKLQVFISSTFTDLKEERQTAVQAVLNAGHLPAGMELFKAGDTSQKETIKKWIEESDVYMLILGGRYGSIDPETGMSYTHWEYEYAKELKKPRFAIVITKDALEQKVKDCGMSVLEQDNYSEYQEFKDVVLSKISKFYSDLKDIKIAVLESLKEFEKDNTLSGWVSGTEIEGTNSLKENYIKLLKEKDVLQSKLEKLQREVTNKLEIDGLPFEDVRRALKQEEILIREKDLNGKHAGENMKIYDLFLTFKNSFATGIHNVSDGKESNIRKFLFYTVSPFLMSFGLVEKVKFSGQGHEMIQTSKEGFKFMKLVLLEKNKTQV